MNRRFLFSFFRTLAVGTAIVSIGLSSSAMAKSARKISIGLAGMRFGNGKSVVKTSAPWSIFPSTEYYYSIKGKWVGKGALATAIPQITNIATFLESVRPGSSKYLSGSVSNPSGTLPATVLNKRISGTRFIKGVGRVKVSMTVGIRILENGLVRFSITKVSAKTASGQKIPGAVRFAGTRVLVTTFPQASPLTWTSTSGEDQ